MAKNVPFQTEFTEPDRNCEDCSEMFLQQNIWLEKLRDHILWEYTLGDHEDAHYLVANRPWSRFSIFHQGNRVHWILNTKRLMYISAYIYRQSTTTIVAVNIEKKIFWSKQIYPLTWGAINRQNTFHNENGNWFQVEAIDVDVLTLVQH